ncbi:RIP metalloprotease RseP [Methylotenera mobilis]|uniref:Zinc metalloprotease n=1 Tax=Methylotenera mobilis (strain JLW8 / ATCC BAA-1282 / DSM 17540) TaxID=583345 RepID=C6WVW8_METML|nr:RIP metalloprotease RseP [Methylotenera mobilis]ACT48067.1 membrane-associated zinc metalloprotease [Methylotenera mobilis JLW8]
MLTTLAFILTIGIVVTVHEYGHFQVARWCGVKVLKFSIGFGHPLWSRKFGKDQTEYVIAAIPLGGYVKMFGEEPLSDATQASDQDMSRALNRQSLGKRMAIVLAGPVANLLLAILLYWVLFMAGVVGMKPVIGKLVDNSPAAMQQLQVGEVVQTINQQSVTSWQDVRWALLKESLKKADIEVQTITQQNEIKLYHLNVSNINLEDEKQDILEKIGFLVAMPAIPAEIGEVTAGSPAEKAGLKTKDLVLELNQIKVNDWEAFVKEIRSHPETPITLIVERNGQPIRLNITPELIEENGEKVGRIGAGFNTPQSELDKLFVTTHYSVAGAMLKAIDKTWDTAAFSLKMMGNMLIGNVSWKGMSGPVTIASYAGQSANMGIKAFIGFLALISISIGVLNLLPIPILDGGHFMYYMVEFFTGRPVSEAVMSIGQRIGVLILAFMMVLAFYNDINRLITG